MTLSSLSTSDYPPLTELCDQLEPFCQQRHVNLSLPCLLYTSGVRDLRRGVLRHVDDRTFPEDPLRVLRGAQFAARFGFTAAPELSLIHI